MSFHCKNPNVPPHKHDLIVDARRCWNPTSSVPAPPRPASPPVPVPAPITVAATHPKDMPHSISPAQKRYINDLGGHWEVDWSYNRASSEITRLLDGAGNRRAPVDPRLEMVKGMVDMIPDGYYATAPDGPGGHVDFVRISRPKRGRYAGAIKFQTQHSERWEEALVKWPNGNWTVYKQPVIETLLLVVADRHGCAKRYAIEVQACMCCNKTLTDDRSRHYLIGPVCDKKDAWQWVFEEVDEKNMGLSFDQLVARGLPTRVWQDHEFTKSA